MIRDSLAICGPTESQTDVCIIGGGTAGIFLATALRRRGIRVVVLELGDSTSRRPAMVQQDVEQRGIQYRGAQLGRSFGLGGTSVLWGGQMIPVTSTDMGARPWIGVNAWPVTYEDIAPYFGEVGMALGFSKVLPTGTNTDRSTTKTRFQSLSEISDDFTVRLSTWLPFQARNFAQEFAESLNNDVDLCIWLNATVTSLDTTPEAGHRRITSVTTRAPKGSIVKIVASHFVLCAGALESTRLLLEHDERTNGSLTRSGAPLGRYFSDHLSATCGRFIRHSRPRFNAAVGPIFECGLMRTPRLELSATKQRTEGLPSAFAHITFRTDGNSGFDIVRNFLRRKQGEQRSLGLSPGQLGNVVRDVTAMAYWRYLRTRLWIPAQAEVLLQIDLEQVPNPDSRLLLSDKRDTKGRKRLIVDWRITAQDVAAIRKITHFTGQRWSNCRLRDLADLQLISDQAFDTFETLYDVYHPTGTIRMGASPSDSVVDSNLRLWAIENCYASTTAVFPSAGSANPGFTHLALTARLADHIGNQIS